MVQSRLNGTAVDLCQIPQGSQINPQKRDLSADHISGRLEKGSVSSQHKDAFHLLRDLIDICIMVQAVPDPGRRRPDRTILSFTL